MTMLDSVNHAVSDLQAKSRDLIGDIGEVGGKLGTVGATLGDAAEQLVRRGRPRRRSRTPFVLSAFVLAAAIAVLVVLRGRRSPVAEVRHFDEPRPAPVPSADNGVAAPV